MHWVYTHNLTDTSVAVSWVACIPGAAQASAFRVLGAGSDSSTEAQQSQDGSEEGDETHVSGDCESEM